MLKHDVTLQLPIKGCESGKCQSLGLTTETTECASSLKLKEKNIIFVKDFNNHNRYENYECVRLTGHSVDST